MQCLLPKTATEDPNSFTTRIAAAFESLIFMADQNLPWTETMSQLLLENKGLTTILKHLISKAEYQIAQAARVTYFIVANRKLIREVMRTAYIK